MKVVTAKEMQTLDQKTIKEYKIPGLTLMENAGRCVVEEMEAAFGPLYGKKVTVVAGKGNNGGDGLVVARLLLEREIPVTVFLISLPQEIHGDAKIHLERYQSMGGKIHLLSDNSLEIFQAVLIKTDLLIDAIYGTGLSSPITGTAADVIKTINQAQVRRKSHSMKTISVDIPSGIQADNGQVLGSAVHAQLTVTFGLPKRGHFLFPGAEHIGRLKIKDIGIPELLIEQSEISVQLLTSRSLAPKILSRPLGSHKGSFGHVVVVAGSVGKSGAAILTSLSALRVGAGLVTLATPKSVESSLHQKPPEIMTLPLDETQEKTLSDEALNPLIQFISDKAVVAIGPGLSTHPTTVELIWKALTQIKQPIVLDADGINALVGHLDMLHQIKTPIILTPHPGEMGRLCGLGTHKVQQDRLGIAMSFSRKYGVIVVLKGAHTVIATPRGDHFINSTGNPGMATAGMGDALTGMIAGLIAQRYEPRLAAMLAVYLHGQAGDLAAQSIGQVGFLAGDLINHIPKAYDNLLCKRSDF